MIYTGFKDEFHKGNVHLYLGDCMELMAQTPDKHYDLAMVDIPYGIGVAKMAYLKEVKTAVKQKNGTKIFPRKKVYQIKDWDNEPPTQQYFNELLRISKHQIIFGVEYVKWEGLGPGRIKWLKGVPAGMSFKSYELAYCSLIDYTYELPLLWSGMQQAKSLAEPMTPQGNKQLNEKRVHPCQKPILLYKTIFSEFGFRGIKCLDTHAGSFSIGIASHEMGIELDACEIDEDYFKAAVKRFQENTQQQTLFAA